MWEPISSQGKPTPDANLACLDLFIATARCDNSSSSPSRRLFNWICSWWQICFAHWIFFFKHSLLFFSVWMSAWEPWEKERQMILSAFWFLLFVRHQPHLSLKERSNMWRESDRQRFSRPNGPIVCSQIRIQTRGALKLLSLPLPPLERAGGRARTCARTSVTVNYGD